MTKIDENKCVGCGICANICSEGIEMAGGKARIKNENADCLKDAQIADVPAIYWSLNPCPADMDR